MGLAIFDLDGTLLNTIADLGAACNYALEKAGYPTHQAEEYPQLVGNGVNKLIERALPPKARTEENVLRVREWFVPYYNEHNCDLTKPYEGIEEVLRILKDTGWQLAVASNKYQAATEKIVKHYFGDRFDVVLGERKSCPRKPDPQIVRDILKECRIDYTFTQSGKLTSATEMIYIGDSDVDIQTARNAGLRVIGCSWGFCKRETLQTLNPDYLIDKPLDILKSV